LIGGGLAKRYAKALLEAAAEAGALEQVAADLAGRLAEAHANL